MFSKVINCKSEREKKKTRLEWIFIPLFNRKKKVCKCEKPVGVWSSLSSGQRSFQLITLFEQCLFLYMVKMRYLCQQKCQPLRHSLHIDETNQTVKETLPAVHQVWIYLVALDSLWEQWRLLWALPWIRSTGVRSLNYRRKNVILVSLVILDFTRHLMSMWNSIWKIIYLHMFWYAVHGSKNNSIIQKNNSFLADFIFLK